MTSDFSDKAVLVTGAAGFLGSNLVDRLLGAGSRITGVDNFISGNREHLQAALSHPNFTLIEADAALPPRSYLPETARFDFIYHLASPASPPRYQAHPVETYLVNSVGTHHLLEYATGMAARVVFTSTSEAYGDPLEHPQKETYWGNVNPVGPRACYDESKRFGEMACTIFAQKYGVDVRIARIFNTYGPRMDPQDGRVVSTFVRQAVAGEDITIEGDGRQTRSFCFVDDLMEYLLRLMTAEVAPGEIVNIGNPDEHPVQDIAEAVKRLTGSGAPITHIPGRPEDIHRRCPDITKAKQLLGYEPKTGLEEGLLKTIEWFRSYGK